MVLRHGQLWAINVGLWLLTTFLYNQLTFLFLGNSFRYPSHSYDGAINEVSLILWS